MALEQLLSLPRTLLAIHRMVDEDLGIAALDEHLWAFGGFHDGLADPRCRARVWKKAPLAGVEPGDVIGLPVPEMALMMTVAMEIEEPIAEYSHQNAQGFGALLPKLGRFMGDSHGPGKHWCESPWCMEERRHANTFARIVERLTKSPQARVNPNRPMIVSSDRASAIRLLISREAAEWNSSSTYIVMAAHATGGLQDLIRNIARDEIKHLGILSAVDTYLFGSGTWRRFRDLVQKSLEEYRGHRCNRSRGELLGTNPITSFEVIAAHLLTERRIRKWLKGLSVRQLASIFEDDASPNASR